MLEGLSCQQVQSKGERSVFLSSLILEEANHHSDTPAALWTCPCLEMFMYTEYVERNQFASTK